MPLSYCKNEKKDPLCRLCRLRVINIKGKRGCIPHARPLCQPPSFLPRGLAAHWREPLGARVPYVFARRAPAGAPRRPRTGGAAENSTKMEAISGAQNEAKKMITDYRLSFFWLRFVPQKWPPFWARVQRGRELFNYRATKYSLLHDDVLLCCRHVFQESVSIS